MKKNTYTYELHLRHDAQTVDVKAKDMDQLFINGAEEILKSIDTYALAVYLENRNPEVAVGLIQQILMTKSNEDRKWAYNLWGNILNDRGAEAARLGDRAANRLFDEAIKKFNNAIQIDPKFERAWNNIGYSYEGKGDLEQAAESYKYATTLNPNDPYPWNGWGDILLKKRNLDGAIEKYQVSAQLPPREWYPWSGWGDALVLKGDFEKARDKYEAAIELDPNAFSRWNSWSPWIGWGTALCRSRNKTDAIRKYEQALALQPSLLVKLRTAVRELRTLKTEQAVGECVPIRGFERLAVNSRAKPLPDRTVIAGMSR
jgi:superkiller protein 3